MPQYKALLAAEKAATRAKQGHAGEGESNLAALIAAGFAVASFFPKANDKPEFAEEGQPESTAIAGVDPPPDIDDEAEPPPVAPEPEVPEPEPNRHGGRDPERPRQGIPGGR